MPRTRMSKTRALVKSEINKALADTTEVKHNNGTWIISPLSDRPYAVNPLDYVAQGDGAQQRTGNRINMLSLNMRANMEMSASQENTRIRVSVVECREPLPLVPVGSSYYYDARGVFDSTASALGANNFFDTDLVKKIHYNKLFTFNQLITNQQIFKHLSKYISFGKRGKKAYYDGNSSTGADLGENTKTHFYIVTTSDTDSSAIDQPGATIVWKMRYTDA